MEEREIYGMANWTCTNTAYILFTSLLHRSGMPEAAYHLVNVTAFNQDLEINSTYFWGKHDDNNLRHCQ